MKEKRKDTNWSQEYQEFLSLEPLDPPAALSVSIRESVQGDLMPSAGGILFKLASTHAVVGSLSLLVCSQFGIGTGGHLEHAFMSLGEPLCRGICGALFFAATCMAALLWMKPSELRRMKSWAYAPIPLLGLVSLALFLAAGAEVALGLAAIWLVGGWLGGAIITEFGRQLRAYAFREI